MYFREYSTVIVGSSRDITVIKIISVFEVMIIVKQSNQIKFIVMFYNSDNT